MKNYIKIAIVITVPLIPVLYVLIFHCEPVQIKSLLLNRWDWLAYIIAAVSLSVCTLSAWSQWHTQKNTAKITPKSQKQLLLDYVRHFYMNLIVISAMREKMRGKYRTHYPAEEHFLKLKVDMSSLHPAIYFNNIEKYQRICKLQALFRNFNEEVDVAITHFSTQNLIDAAKERDLDTLTFKMGLLTKKVIEVLYLFDTTNVEQELRKIIKTSLKDRNKEYYLLKADEYFKSNPQILQTFPTELRKSLYKYSLKAKCTWIRKASWQQKRDAVTQGSKIVKEALHEINRHIYVEMNGKNSSGSDKIYLIPFSQGYRLC